MLRVTPSRISPELARQDHELAGVHYRAVMEGSNALDREGVERFRAAQDRREAALGNLLTVQAS